MKKPGLLEAITADIKNIARWAWGHDLVAFLLPLYFAGSHDVVPHRIVKAIEKVLVSMGGKDKITAVPHFSINMKGLSQNPAMWILPIDFSPGNSPSKLNSWEDSFEETLTASGMDYNVRIKNRPLRLEIDKPVTPTINFFDYWRHIADLPRNKRLSSPGIEYTSRGDAVMKIVEHRGEGFGSFVVAISGAGKTQLCLSMILSLGISNSPSHMSMVIIDPKAMDTLPFKKLPHLAMPIVTHWELAVEVVQRLVDEMDARTIMALKGDNSFVNKVICLYVDELADILAQMPSGKVQKQFIVNLQRLGQTGRSRGFIFIFGTQRVAGIPNETFSNLNLRFVGKMRNAMDSVMASGLAGVQSHKLPGKGSFELWPEGDRIQGYFVGDSEAPDYDEQLKPYLDDIRSRWATVEPHWVYEESIELDIESEDGELLSYPNTEAGLRRAVMDAYSNHEGDVTTTSIRTLWKELHGRDLSPQKRRFVQELIESLQESNTS